MRSRLSYFRKLRTVRKSEIPEAIDSTASVYVQTIGTTDWPRKPYLFCLPDAGLFSLFFRSGRSLYEELAPLEGSLLFRLKYLAVRKNTVPAPSDNTSTVATCTVRERNIIQVKCNWSSSALPASFHFYSCGEHKQRLLQN